MSDAAESEQVTGEVASTTTPTSSPSISPRASNVDPVPKSALKGLPPRAIIVLMSIIVVVTLALLAVIFRYDAFSAGTGAYVFDRWTGSTTMIAADGRAIAVDLHRSVAAPVLLPITMERHGNATLSIKLKWRSGKAYYDFSIDPLSEELKVARQSMTSRYTARLQDEDGFEVAQIRFTLGSMTRIVDADDNPTALREQGSVEMSREDFGAIEGWTVVWNF